MRVIAPDVGGGFGEKGGVFPEDVAVAYLAVALGQPIQWVADHRENMLGFHGRGHMVDVEAAVKNDGMLLGIRLRIVADAGAYFGNSTPGSPYRTSHRIVGPYKTPAARVEVLRVFTHKPPTGAYRGAGGPEAAFCMERTIDLMAQELDMGPGRGAQEELYPARCLPVSDACGPDLRLGQSYAGWRARARQRKHPHEPLIATTKTPNTIGPNP